MSCTAELGNGRFVVFFRVTLKMDELAAVYRASRIEKEEYL